MNKKKMQIFLFERQTREIEELFEYHSWNKKTTICAKYYNSIAKRQERYRVCLRKVMFR